MVRAGVVVTGSGVVSAGAGSGATFWTAGARRAVVVAGFGAGGLAVVVVLGVAVVVVALGVTVSVATTCRSCTGWCCGVPWLSATAKPPPMTPAATSERAPTVNVLGMLIGSTLSPRYFAPQRL